MILTQRARGVRFGWVGMDAGYGKDRGLLRAWSPPGKPSSPATEEDIQKALARRHRRRQTDIDSKKHRNPAQLIDIL